MPMSPRLLKPRASGATHPEAASWATRVVTNGGTVGSSTLAAVSKFCRDIDAAGIRSKFYRLNLFCGTGLNACLVPLYVNTSSGGVTLGNTTDTNNGPFVSGDYSETGSSTGGLKGNGTTKHLDTGVNASALGFSVTSFHLAYYAKGTEAAGTSRYAIAATSSPGANNVGLGWLSAGSVERYHYTPTGGLGGTASSSGGLEGMIAGESNASGGVLYHQGSSLATAAQVPTSTFANVPFFVFWDGGGALSRTLGRYMRGYSIGLSMSGPQWSSYYAAMQAFQTTLTRNV